METTYHWRCSIAQRRGQGAREIFLWRYKTTIQQSSSTGKRKIGSSQSVTNKSGSRYEFVNIRRLLAFIRGQFYQFKTPILTFSTLVAMTGCDFTLNLPKIGPARLWACKEWFRSLEGPDGTDYETELSRIILRLYADLRKVRCASTPVLGRARPRNNLPLKQSQQSPIPIHLTPYSPSRKTCSPCTSSSKPT